MDTHQVPIKKWTVTMKDGTVYRGVQATSAEEAARKMAEGPKGPMAPPSVAGSPTRVPRGSASFAGLPELARTVPLMAAGPAGAAGLLASEVSQGPQKPSGGVSAREVIGDLVPAAVAALVPPARTMGSFGKALGGNILGRAGVEAGAEALSPTGQGPLAAGLKGAAKGVLPGMVQGGLGAMLGPSADTIKAQKAMKALKGSVSPEVGAFLDESNPAALLKRSTPRQMTKAAGTNLDAMEAYVSKQLGNKKFSIISGPAVAQRTFDDVRAEIKALREAGSQGYSTPELRGKAKDSLKQAAMIEADMLRQMPPELVKKYQTATARHAADMDAVRFVRALHKREMLMGGASATDRPGLADAQKALEKRGLGKVALYGGLSALEGATGRGYGAAYYGSKAMANLGKASPLRPASKVASTVPRISGALGGIGTAAGQTKFGQSKAFQPADEDQ